VWEGEGWQQYGNTCSSRNNKQAGTRGQIYADIEHIHHSDNIQGLNQTNTTNTAEHADLNDYVDSITKSTLISDKLQEDPLSDANIVKVDHVVKPTRPIQSSSPSQSKLEQDNIPHVSLLNQNLSPCPQMIASRKKKLLLQHYSNATIVTISRPTMRLNILDMV
jgi:hypothetical protein